MCRSGSVNNEIKIVSSWSANKACLTEIADITDVTVLINFFLIFWNFKHDVVVENQLT